MLEGTYKFEQLEIQIGNRLFLANGEAELVEDNDFADYGCYVDHVRVVDVYDEEGEEIPLSSLPQGFEMHAAGKLDKDDHIQDWFLWNVWSEARH